MSGLTPRQYQALVFIDGHVREHGSTPSFPEIGAALGLKSKSSVARLIDRLVERGYLRRGSEGSARALSVVKVPTGEIDPYSVEALSGLPDDRLTAVQDVVMTLISSRLRERVLASPAGSCPALEKRA